MPADQVVGRLVGEPGDRRLKQREVDPLAGAFGRRSGPALPTEGRQDRHGPEHAGGQVAIATPTLVGLPPAASGGPVSDIRPATAWMMKS